MASDRHSGPFWPGCNRMNGVGEGPPLPSEGKARIALAWLSLWLMLTGGGGLAFSVLVFAALLVTGGVELVSDVLAERETGDYGSIIYTSLFIGLPPGAIFGVRLWAKLMRRTGWISAERIKRMSGF